MDDSKKKKKQGRQPAQQQQQPQRTIQVKIGGQAAKTMTPDQAADYLKSIAGKGAFSSGREVKMTFNNNTTATATLGATSGSGSKSTPRLSATQRSVSLTTSEVIGGIGVSSATMDTRLPYSTSSARAMSSSATAAAVGSSRKDGMPCSEKEMKALMSMFVEIMGLQMNTDKLNSTKPRVSPKKRKTLDDSAAAVAEALFQFPEDLPPPPGGWPEDLLWPSSSTSPGGNLNGDGSHDDEVSIDSLPELEDVGSNRKKNGQRGEATTAKTATTAEEASTSTAEADLSSAYPPIPQVDPEPVTGMAGIAAFEWEVLERVAIEDALEQEERVRKAAKKRDSNKKSGRNKRDKGRTSAADMAAIQAKSMEAFAKKREKAIQSWKSRVTSVVQSNEVTRLDTLLENESPLRKEDSEKVLQRHLDTMVPQCLPKNRASAGKGRETRERLAKYILSLRPSCMTTTFLRDGRSAFHTACFYAELDLMRLIGEKVKKEDLNITCHDSGWAPLHYAALSGSMQAMEIVLEFGGDTSVVTNDTHTWRVSNGKGLSIRDTIDCLVRGHVDKEIETHGMALQEVSNEFVKASSSADKLAYIALLERMSSRLKDVEANGYTQRTADQIAQEEELARRSIEDKQEAASQQVAVKKSKKKKKKKEGRASSTGDADPSAAEGAKLSAVDTKSDSKESSTETEELSPTSSEDSSMSQQRDDPMVAALVGMGFSEEHIMDGIRACGGVRRATADDVVAWIFGQDATSGQIIGGRPAPAAKKRDSFAVVRNDDEDQKPSAKEGKGRRSRGGKGVAAEARRQQAAAKRVEEERLAAERQAKREEQRRRNREWNNRAQARQLQEAQTKFTKATVDIKRTEPARPRGGSVGLAGTPASNYFPTPAAARAPTQGLTASMSPKPGESLPKNLPDNVITNDASTIASSIDNTDFDDATVSTLGSMPARVATPVGSQLGTSSGSANNPPKITQQAVPPGFGHSGASPSELPPQPVVDLRLGTKPFVAQNGPPPGIPETKPLVVEQGLTTSSNSAVNASSGSAQPRLATVHDTLHGAGNLNAGLLGAAVQARHADVNPAGSSLGSSQMFLPPQPMPTGPPGSRVLSGESLSSIPSTVAPSAPSPQLVGSGALGFGQLAPDNGTSHQPLDASIIDSISTGNGDFMAGRTLWGGPANGNATAGSSLLGDLLQTSSAGGTMDGEQMRYDSNGKDLFDRRGSGGLWGSQGRQDFRRSGSGSIW